MFLERFDFTGKIIKPFCTYEYDGMGHSEDDIRHACPKAQVKSGMAICGAAIQAEIADITEWIPLKRAMLFLYLYWSTWLRGLLSNFAGYDRRL